MQIWDLVVAKNAFYLVSIALGLILQMEETILRLDTAEFLNHLRSFKNCEDYNDETRLMLQESLLLSKNYEIT